MKSLLCLGSALLALCAAESSAWANIFPLSGYVGIGTDSPQNSLHIFTNPSDRQIRMGDPFGFWEFWAGGNFHIRQNGAADRFFIAGESGNVGIGTLGPSQKLHVLGNVLASGHLTHSDERLKADVVPLDGALEAVRGLRGVSFTWNDDAAALGYPFDRREMGLIAQEVEEVLPELVVSPVNGYKAVDYGRLTGLLVEAIKELEARKDAQIAELETRIRILEQAKPDASLVSIDRVRVDETANYVRGD